MEALIFDICILTNPKKRSLVAETLVSKELPFKVHSNAEWPLPPQDEFWDNRARRLEPKQEVAYRIFRGHQETCKLIEKNWGLILEDDAVPREMWIDGVHQAIEVLEINHYDVVALYGRALNWIKEEFQYKGKSYKIPGKHPEHQVSWTNGAVAYVVRKEVGQQISQDRFKGIPYDLHLPEFYKFCVPGECHQSFDHSYAYGSMFHSPIPPLPEMKF